MTERVKIKCDDCKFVEDCVDYGWQGCKKFTPAPSTPMTNEEWLRNLSFNELARVLYCMIINGERIRPDLAYIKQWLKEKHNESV